MTEVVLDCSVTMAWCFEDQETPYTDDVLEALVTGRALVPQIWSLEVTNVLLLAERHTRLTAAESGRFWQLLHELPIVIDEKTGGRAREDILHLGRTYRLTSYDAAYLELSMRSGAALATVDRGLRRAAAEAGAGLFGVP